MCRERNNLSTSYPRIEIAPAGRGGLWPLAAIERVERERRMRGSGRTGSLEPRDAIASIRRLFALGPFRPPEGDPAQRAERGALRRRSVGRPIGAVLSDLIKTARGRII